jgi:uncharacterized protein YcbK (DUF882 family)
MRHDCAECRDGRTICAARPCAGGVGYHPADDFVHVDVGRVRRW